MKGDLWSDCVIWSFRVKRNFNQVKRGICFSIYGGNGIEYWHESDGMMEDYESEFKFTNGDRVTYILDLNERSFKGKINDNSEFVIAKDIETSKDIWYSMRVCVMLKHDQVALLGFWHQFYP